jgi:hypothetical protein
MRKAKKSHVFGRPEIARPLRIFYIVLFLFVKFYDRYAGRIGKLLHPSQRMNFKRQCGINVIVGVLRHSWRWAKDAYDDVAPKMSKLQGCGLFGNKKTAA